METAITPGFKVTYQGKDISADLAPYLIEAVYTDKLTGQSDELDLTVADHDGRWFKDWYPPKGAEIKYEYGYAHEPLASAGSFTVDEVEMQGPPDTVRIRALATGLQRQARTRIGKAYENTTLRGIVETVAKRLKAKVFGDIASIKIPKASQYGETDWAFLVRICREYGYEIKLTDNNQKLVVAKLSGAAVNVKTIRKSDVKSYTYRDKITEIPAKTKVSNYNPRKKKLVTGEANAKGKETASDNRNRSAGAQSPEQAKAIAEAEQERHEQDKTSLELTLVGDKKLVAGATVTIIEWGAVNGEYMIVEAKHSTGSSAYETTIQVKKIKESVA